MSLGTAKPRTGKLVQRREDEKTCVHVCMFVGGCRLYSFLRPLAYAALCLLSFSFYRSPNPCKAPLQGLLPWLPPVLLPVLSENVRWPLLVLRPFLILWTKTSVCAGETARLGAGVGASVDDNGHEGKDLVV